MKKIEKKENEILKSFENDEWKSIKKLENKKEDYSKYAKNTAAKNKRINIRLSEKVLAEIKAKSLEEGIPYQTLIASIIHKYVNGKFKEI
jgi:predicted DNA binding CopG/RHH family protein